MFVLKRLIFGIFVSFILFSGLSNISSADYQVKTIYFIPTDSQDRSAELDLDDIMKSIQLTCQLEMERHGFHGTFELETDKEGKVIVHRVKGDENKAYYAGGTFFRVKEELESKSYNDRDSIYITIMADMKLLENGLAEGVASGMPYGGLWGNDFYSGYAMIAEGIDRANNRFERVIRHELCHCFGLKHVISDDRNRYIMGGGHELSIDQARWLSRNHYFNVRWNNNHAPKVTKFHGAFVYKKDKIMFRADVHDHDGLFQSYAHVNGNAIAFSFYHGDKNIVMDFVDIDRKYLHSDSIGFHIMDIHGNWMWYGPVKYILPEIPTDEEVNKNPNLLTDEDHEIPNSIFVSDNLVTSWAVIKSR